MKRNIIKYLSLIGLVGLLFSCQKDETKVEMLASPIAPKITTVPDLTLIRDKGTNVLVFAGTVVDPGFVASAIYYLEADTAGNKFANPVVLGTAIVDTFKMTISTLNGLLIKRFPTDKVSALELRVRSVLVASAGTGATAYSYISETKPVSATTYGLPRLDLYMDGAVSTKIESALGNGSYSGYVKLDASKTFTLKDPDKGIVYGNNGGALGENGSGITASASGWYKLTVDTKKLTYTAEAYMIGLVGSATANGWNSPDTKMDYNSKEDCWYAKTALTDGQIKFRLNDGWALNWGGTGTSDGSADNYASDKITVALGAGGKNIGLNGGAGTYTVKLYISALKATVVKN